MKISECVDFLRAEDNFLLLTHVRPDGDTLCSASALCSALRRLGKTAALYPNSEMTENFFPFVKPFVAGEIPETPCVVSIDTAGEHMLARGFTGRVELCIDHHGSNTLYAANTFVDPSSSSCGEIIMNIIEALCGGIEPCEADLLYIAESTDTGCFCYGNTTSETLKNAAHLMDCGARSKYLNKYFFRSFSYSRLKLEGLIYAGLRSYRDNKINIAVVTLDMMERAGATENDCDDLASLAGKVKGNVVAITIRELEGGNSKASVRTNELVDASAVCAVFGGGGHPMASGCTIDASPDRAAEMLLAAVNDIWK